jgi:hypothetical protein
MSTERPRVQSYLDPEVYQKLKEFQQEQGLKESAALNQILKEYFGLEASNRPSAPLQIEEKVDEQLNKQWNEFNLFRVELKTEVWLQLKKEFAIWNESLQKAVSQLSDRLETLEEICKPIEGLAELSKPIESSNSPSDSPSNLPDFLNAANLARRLGISKSVISRRKSETNFEDWSKQLDPAGIGWRFPGKGQRFFPVITP